MLELTEDQKIIVDILQDRGAKDDQSALSKQDLISACHAQGITKGDAIERAVTTLIDRDVVDYEMDKHNRLSEIWLL